MTPLEAVRQMQENEPVSYGSVDPTGDACVYCAGRQTPDTLHRPDCPWLLLPQIVAALEGIVSDDLTVAELCDAHAKMCGGTWPGCPMKPERQEA